MKNIPQSCVIVRNPVQCTQGTPLFWDICSPNSQCIFYKMGLWVSGWINPKDHTEKKLSVYWILKQLEKLVDYIYGKVNFGWYCWLTKTWQHLCELSCCKMEMFSQLNNILEFWLAKVKEPYNISAVIPGTKPMQRSSRDLLNMVKA